MSIGAEGPYADLLAFADAQRVEHRARVPEIPQVGAVIEPSGRHVDRLAVDDERVLREGVLEAVRADDLPDLPSRNDLVFTWPDIRDARRYVEGGSSWRKHAGDELVYVVTPASGAQVFRGDSGWLAQTGRSLEERAAT